MLTALGAIVGILRLIHLDQPSQQIVPTKQLIILCIVIGSIAGLVTLIEARRVYKSIRAKTILTQLFGKGRKLTSDMSQPVSKEQDTEIRSWRGQVENCLNKYLDSSYVERFQIRGNRIMMADMGLIQWWEAQQGVERIAEFLQDLARK